MEADDKAQWDAVFLRVLKSGDVDRAIATADKAAPLHAGRRRGFSDDKQRERSERGRRWGRSRPWKRTKKRRG